MESHGPQKPAGPSLPLIDISPYLSSSSDPAAIAVTNAALRSALLDHGFFYLTNHGINDSVLQNVIGHARTFFLKAPAEEKRLLKRADVGVGLGDGARGYQIIGENVTQGHQDWHEAVDWYAPIDDGEGVEAGELVLQSDGAVTVRADRGRASGMRKTDEVNGSAPTRANGTSSSAHVPRNPPFALLQGLNPWPITPPTFRSVFESHIRQMRSLGRAVLLAMGHALGLSDPTIFATAAQDSFWVLRAIGYPPLDPSLATQGGVSCGEHSDYGCLTLLLADETPGALQVRDKTGTWMNVEPVPGALVVNVGDMVERWTAGWVRSTKHRVVHTGQGFRVSVPFFLEPGAEVVVGPLAECVERVKAEGREPVEGKVRYWDHLVGKVGGNFYQPDKEQA